MRSSSLFLLLLSAIAIFFFAAIPFAQSKLDSELPTQGESGKEKLRPWPCCDRCGVCTKSIPPLCTCMDKVRSCHPACKNCVRSPLSSNPPLYQCMDIIVNYCKNKCSSDVKTFEQY